MAYEPVAPRYAQPPPALTNMGSNNRASFLSYMSEMSASAASAASASSLSAALAASSTADAENYSTESSSESQSQTRVTLSNPVPQTTASNPTASQTDSSGSSITSPATQSSQRSTFATSVATNSAASEHGPHYPDSSLQTADKGYHSGPSSGKIAAAVVIPLVFLLALGFGLFYLRRRRRRRAAALAGQPYHHHHPMTDRSPFSKEAALAKPAPRHPNPNGAPAPILTSATNNTYYTGLSTPTTPSRASTQTRGRSNDSTRPGAQTASIYDIPPPAYARDAPPGSTPTLPQLSFATDPFMDPVSPISTSDHTSATSPTGAALAALSGRDTAFTATSLSPAQHSVPRPNISRAGTMRSVTSVTSDMYSDTASVRSARPERFSGATAQVVVGSAGNVNRLSGGSFAPGSIVRDPFGDPK